MQDEQFSVWEFKEPSDQDDFVLTNLMNTTTGGLGANDPNAINWIGHQRNFEDAIQAISENRAPAVSAFEAMKSVQLIRAIYESAQNDGKWITLG